MANEGMRSMTAQETRDMRDEVKAWLKAHEVSYNPFWACGDATEFEKSKFVSDSERMAFIRNYPKIINPDLWDQKRQDLESTNYKVLDVIVEEAEKLERYKKGFSAK